VEPHGAAYQLNWNANDWPGLGLPMEIKIPRLEIFSVRDTLRIGNSYVGEGHVGSVNAAKERIAKMRIGKSFEKDTRIAV